MGFAAKNKILAAAIIILGSACLVATSNFVESVRPPVADEIRDQDLALHGSKLKGFAFGMEGLIADWYWMSALQYIGKKIIESKEEVIDVSDLRPLNPRLLYPYLDNAIDLDPEFMAVYSYGALVLPAIDPEKAIALTQKGINNNPDRWRLYQYLGYIYWKLGRYDEASQVYKQGSEKPGAPSHLLLMAGATKNEGGSRETARSIYTQMLAEAGDSESEYYASLRLRYLDSLDERDAIRQELLEFKNKNGQCAAKWSEILPQLKTVKLPHGREFRIDAANSIVDPSDTPYIIDREKCDVLLDREKTKIPFN